MAFTNNRPEFRQGQSYTEELHAKALNEGIPSFVKQGLELTGTTLTAGVAINAGVPGQWGNLGETHTITANYTGFIILKTVLDGANGLNSIVEDTVRNDTDPRSTEKTRYFTIYELNNGTIVQDFRHINYVKSFYLKNMGGSNIAWVLNGFTSETFDASVLAGNRTLINDKDIDYDDTIHGATPIEDILLDLFTKSQTNVGNDKPFILSFSTTPTPNFFSKLSDLILFKNGCKVLETDGVFTMEANTDNGLSGQNNGNITFCSYESSKQKFLFMFDYDGFANVDVKDEKIDFNALQTQNCANYIRKVTETSDPVIINTIGDSLTRGYDIVNGTDETYSDDNGDSATTKVVSESMPETLVRWLNDVHSNVFTLVNSGWSGDNAEGSSGRWFLDKNEDITTIMLGTNDNFQNVPFEEFQKHMEIQIKRRLTFGSAVVLMTPPHVLERTSSGMSGYRQILQKLSVKYGIELIDMEEITSQFDYNGYSDNTHFNQDGYHQAGWKLVAPFMRGNMFKKHQTIKSGDTINFWRGEHEHFTNGILALTDDYPTKRLDDANIGTALNNGGALFLEPGEDIFLPVYLEEKNLLFVPQVFGSPFGVGSVGVQRGLYLGESVENAYNYVDSLGADQTIPPLDMYPKASVGITSSILNYFSGSVFCLRGCITTNAPQSQLINIPSKGWNMFLISNSTDQTITVHAIDFIGQYEYYALTGQPPVAYTS